MSSPSIEVHEFVALFSIDKPLIDYIQLHPQIDKSFLPSIVL